MKFIIDGKECTFDPDAKVHGDRYKIDGVRATGVTSALQAISKPQLIDWSAKMAYEDCRDGADPKERLESKKYAHKTFSQTAKDKGTDYHKDFEEWNLENPAVRQVKEFFDKNGITVIRKEFPVFYPQYFFAGTSDVLIEWNGKRYIADYKTSSGLYGREYFAQLSAYLHGYGKTYPEQQQPVGYMVIRVDKNGGKFDETVNPTTRNGNLSTYGNVYVVENPSIVKSDFLYFLCCMGVYRNGLIDCFEEVEPIINMYK